MLDLCEVTNLARDVATGFHGIDEPLAHCGAVDPAAIDWVLVPGVAFDAACHRLGYGGGYYDRLLPLVPAAAPRIAGAFDVQIVERVPAAPHDIAIDAVVTESRRFAKSP
jgi:5-formyltetrahydrofolate cyclo-ligase